MPALLDNYYLSFVKILSTTHASTSLIYGTSVLAGAVYWPARGTTLPRDWTRRGSRHSRQVTTKTRRPSLLITEAVKLNLVTKAKELNYKVGSRVESGSSQGTELLQCTGLAQVYRKMSNCNSPQLLQVTTCRIEKFFLSLKIKLYVT